jgi:hypothetical protein
VVFATQFRGLVDGLIIYMTLFTVTGSTTVSDLAGMLTAYLVSLFGQELLSTPLTGTDFIPPRVGAPSLMSDYPVDTE